MNLACQRQIAVGNESCLMVWLVGAGVGLHVKCDDEGPSLFRAVLEISFARTRNKLVAATLRIIDQ
jgi:hypothetical protein